MYCSSMSKYRCPMSTCECGQILDVGIKTCHECGSANNKPATYQELVNFGIDPWYAAELTGDMDQARNLMKDYTPIIVPPREN